MADIFINYSKTDHDKVVMLSAYLESEGWTAWWDTNLAPGDTFWDEIMKQLVAGPLPAIGVVRNSTIVFA